MDTPRNIESQVEIAVPADAVWKALTDAEELTRWFPLDARVKPGNGGSIWMSWRNEYQFETPIEVWEDGKHLRLVYVEATPPPKPGDPPPPFVIPYRVAVDYYIEGKGGSTIVRLVHSGFSRDASWDNQYDGTVRGWAFQLNGLKAYLEGHRGERRDVVYIRRVIPTVAVNEAWNRIVGESGLFALDDALGDRSPTVLSSTPSAAVFADERKTGQSPVPQRETSVFPTFEPGMPIALKLPFGKPIRGKVHNYAPNRELWMKPDDPAMPTLRVQIDDSFGKRDVTLWISTFGLAPERLQQLRDDLTSEMLRLFPESLDPADAFAGGPGATPKLPEPGTRSFEQKMEITASLDDVWKAISDAEELTRWFPLDARVTPGVGGNIWLSWGAGFEGDTKITIWEPGNRLRMESLRERATADGSKQTFVIAVDYFLESRGNQTVLRLVHSGFGQTSEWDGEYDAIARGWKFEHGGLKHYLENHRGEKRTVAWARCSTKQSPDEVWQRLSSSRGLCASGSIADAEAGDPLDITTAGGLRLSGTVYRNAAPKSFVARIANLNNAFLRIDIERWGPEVQAWLWLSLYGEAGSRAAQLEADLTALLKQCLET